MRFVTLLAALVLLGGCSSSDPMAEESELFGRWWPSSPRFGGLIVSTAETSSKGRTETEYLFQLNYVVKLDQTDNLVTVAFDQNLEGPRTDYVYNKDGTLAVRLTSNVKTMEGATWGHVYSGRVEADGAVSTLMNGDGHGLAVSFIDGKLRLEFEYYPGLFNSFTRSFYDFRSGSAQPTAFVAHFTADPYVLELDYDRGP
ncbi:MAG: hypothetical protein ACI9W4_002676 [Rhodothermales bacterium]|jgi:hypothetical protein